MNKIIKNLLAFTIVFLAMQAVLSAQTACGAGVTGCPRTTLSAAQAAGAAAKQFTVASATGIVASIGGFNLTTGSGGEFYCLIDRELERVASVSGTLITVTRGAASTLAVGHVSGAQVVCGLGGGSWNSNTGATQGVFMTGNGAPPSGACTRTSMQFAPIFQISSPVTTGFMYDCLGGKWVQGTLPDAPDATPLVLASNIPIGTLAYSSAIYTQTIAGGTTVEFLTSIMVPKSGFVTGIKFLCGSTCTTDNALAILRDSGGNVIANAATAGVLLSGASTFQTQNFTAKVFLAGPARYFIGVQFSGNTAADMAAIATATYIDVVCGQLTGGTFGTIVNPATMPTTFTAGQCPIAQIVY